MREADHKDLIQIAARNLFLGCAPERNAELECLWAEYRPKFRLTEDAGRDGLFVLDGGLFRFVRFNHRAMRAFWFAGFIAWEGYRTFARSTDEHDLDLTRFRSMIETFNEMLSAEDPESVPLPSDVPEPGHYVSDSPEARAAAELATIATGWAFLHEIRHIQHQQKGTGAAYNAPATDKHAEELSCDNFATTFIMERLSDYATQSGDPEDKVQQKRELGIYFAFFAMTLIAVDQWDESDSHPAMQTRIEQSIRSMGTDGTRMSDAIAHSAFAALWKIYPNAPGPFKAK